MTAAPVALLLALTQAITVEHLVVPAPGEYELEKKNGPDFAVYYLHPKGARLAVLGMYLGNFPNAFAPKQGTRQAPFRLGRRKGKWVSWQTSEAGVMEVHAEAILERPFGIEPPYATHLHLFLAAPTEEELRVLQTLAAAIRGGDRSDKPVQ